LSYFRLSPVLHDSVILLHTCFFLRIKISSRRFQLLTSFVK